MDINSLVNREDIQKEVDKNKKGGGEMVDSRFWRIPDGKSAIRLLPRLESRVPWRTVYSHRYNKSGEKLFGTCLATFNKKDCPVCKKSWKMWESEDKSTKDLGYQVRKTPRYIMNCYVVSDAEKPENNGTIKILSVGKKLFELILENYNSEDVGPAVFDATNGFDFEINRKKSGDNPDYPDYSSSRFTHKKYGVVKTWSAIEDKLINIDELTKEESAEDLMKKFSFLGFDAPMSTPKAEPKKTVEKVQVKKEEIVIDEIEDDVDKEDVDKGLDDFKDIEDELDAL